MWGDKQQAGLIFANFMIIITSVNLIVVCFLLSLHCFWQTGVKKTGSDCGLLSWMILLGIPFAADWENRKRMRKIKWGGQRVSTDWESRTQEAPACVEDRAFIWPRSHQVVSLFTLSPRSSLWPSHYWLPWATPFSTTFIDLKRACHFPISLFPPEWVYRQETYPPPPWSSLGNRGIGLIS